jgi:hypothetical protein
LYSRRNAFWQKPIQAELPYKISDLVTLSDGMAVLFPVNRRS